MDGAFQSKTRFDALKFRHEFDMQSYDRRRVIADCSLLAEKDGQDMIRIPLTVCLPLVVVTAASTAMAQTKAVPLRGLDYGAGRIDVANVRDYAGQTASVCGRVVRVDGRNRILWVSDLLKVEVRANVDVTKLYGTVACAKGLVELKPIQGGGSYAQMSANSAAQIEQIGGTGPYTPPRR